MEKYYLQEPAIFFYLCFWSHLSGCIYLIRNNTVNYFYLNCDIPSPKEKQMWNIYSYLLLLVFMLWQYNNFRLGHSNLHSSQLIMIHFDNWGSWLITVPPEMFVSAQTLFGFTCFIAVAPLKVYVELLLTPHEYCLLCCIYLIIIYYILHIFKRFQNILCW